eukprot:2335936-Rhodomonas_salina.2
MASKIIAFSAIVATASAFAPSAGLPTGLRLRESSTAITMKGGRAPIVTVFDHRGCSRAPKEFTGDKTETQDDEMMIKVSFQQVQVAEEEAIRVLQQSLSAGFNKLQNK